MALGASTPDRARIQRKVRGARVEGRYTETAVWTDSFRCRYRPESETESRDDARVRRVKPAGLTALARTMNTGEAVTILASDVVEITKRDGEVLTFQVKGTPKPIRKRSRTIGWHADLEKVTG
jgi:class 3 adenylate cyclase